MPCVSTTPRRSTEDLVDNVGDTIHIAFDESGNDKEDNRDQDSKENEPARDQDRKENETTPIITRPRPPLHQLSYLDDNLWAKW